MQRQYWWNAYAISWSNTAEMSSKVVGLTKSMFRGIMAWMISIKPWIVLAWIAGLYSFSSLLVYPLLCKYFICLRMVDFPHSPGPSNKTLMILDSSSWYLARFLSICLLTTLASEPQSGKVNMLCSSGEPFSWESEFPTSCGLPNWNSTSFFAQTADHFYFLFHFELFQPSFWYSWKLYLGKPCPVWWVVFFATSISHGFFINQKMSTHFSIKEGRLCSLLCASLMIVVVLNSERFVCKLKRFLYLW